MAVNGSHSGGSGDSLWKPRVKKTWAINYRLRGRSSLQGGVGIQHVIRRENGVLLGKAFLGFFPTATMVFFQGLFAGITLILIAGALLGRMNFRVVQGWGVISGSIPWYTMMILHNKPMPSLLDREKYIGLALWHPERCNSIMRV
ncbi:Ammonium transporter 3 member 3 [Glycine soja]|uniref:Ammonium transporter 3 member 3 n=1 Tax=Glycine soja TaxID=3848 RepID=A0A0B2RGK2_GLYSO|nr:hypothetical protein JHK87_008297 [Glycine soja]KHN31459.1 Ammonium transporter 3 member 3 [Glycine soja]